MDVFDALDLTEGEKKVYKALLILGETSTGPLYKEANVSQSKVYEILERLKRKGLAAAIKKSDIQYWHAANPSIYLEKVKRKLEDLEEKKDILEKELPSLLKKEQEQEEAQVLEGYNGFRTALYGLLAPHKKGETFSVLGSPLVIPEPFYSFLRAYNKERAKKGIRARFLYGEGMRSFAETLYGFPRTELQFMKGLTPSTIAIGKDRIIIMSWKKGGKFIVIMGKDIANNYRKFFDSLWKMSKS